MIDFRRRQLSTSCHRHGRGIWGTVAVNSDGSPTADRPSGAGLLRDRLARPSGGFTLLELIIYFGVIGLTLTAAVGFAAEFLSLQSRAAAYRDIGRDGRYAIERMAVEIREADGLNVGDSVFGSSPGRLSLSTAGPAGNPTVFAVSGGSLTVSRGGGPAEPVLSSASAVSAFTVDNVSVSGRSRVFRLTLDLVSTDTSQSPVKATFQTSVNVRKGKGFVN